MNVASLQSYWFPVSHHLFIPQAKNVLWSLGPQHKEGEVNMNRKWGLNWQEEPVLDREKDENVSSGGYALWLFFLYLSWTVRDSDRVVNCLRFASLILLRRIVGELFLRKTSLINKPLTQALCPHYFNMYLQSQMYRQINKRCLYKHTPFSHHNASLRTI